MAKYEGGYRSAYLEALMAEYFRNSLRYFRETVSDEDYFAPSAREGKRSQARYEIPVANRVLNERRMT